MGRRGMITIVICGIVILALILIARLIAPGNPVAAGFTRASHRLGAVAVTLTAPHRP